MPHRWRVQRADAVADATGIALDGGTLAATRDIRAELGLNDMPGARNTGSAVYASGAPQLPATVAELFRMND